MSRVLVLGLETSCDETGAAIVRADGDVLSDIVQSQVKLHAPYGGVVPELASRDHLKNVRPVVLEAASRAGVSLADVDGLAVTCRPGLTGALLVGVQAARGLSWSLDKPLVGVDHLVGHLLSVFLRFQGITNVEPPAYPFVALLASGGHTALDRVDAPRLDRIRELGATRDDAAGEAFDKVARMLGLGYPGGPAIDRLAHGANDRAHDFTVARIKDGRPDFSFSGLKTAVLYHVRREGIDAVPEGAPVPEEIRDLVASFQRAVVTALLRGLERAAQERRPRSLLLTGGVAANTLLRTEAARTAQSLGLPLFVPPVSLSTDNAAMIGAAGFVSFRKGLRLGWDANAFAQMAL
jgi:N6-L-threonylcarbamoyladenine synthase